MGLFKELKVFTILSLSFKQTHVGSLPNSKVPKSQRHRDLSDTNPIVTVVMLEVKVGHVLM